MLHFSSLHCKVWEMKSSRPYHNANLPEPPHPPPRVPLPAAAGDALGTGGAPSIPLRELSRELGVSHTSPRRHFADKQALMNALALRGFERLDGALGRAAGQ